MDWGLWLSIVLGLGVAGHAVVGTVLGTRLAVPTRPLWSPFGEHGSLLRLNGLLLVIASLLHLAVSAWKAWDADGAVFWSSVLPFPLFAVAGWLERRPLGWMHHVMMASGWLAFAWHASVAA